MREAGLPRLPPLMLAVCLLCCAAGGSLSAAAGRSGGAGAEGVLIGEVDIAMRADEADDEDGAGGGSAVGSDDEDEDNAVPGASGHGEEPFARKCLVDGRPYSHSDMIPSKDRSSHCLCVAGEVYCWWQTYGAAGPTRSTTAAPPFPDAWTTEETRDPAAAAAEVEGPREASGTSSGGAQDDNAEAAAVAAADSVELIEEDEEEDEEGDEEEDEDEEEGEEDGEESLESNDLPQAALEATATTNYTPAGARTTAARQPPPADTTTTPTTTTTTTTTTTRTTRNSSRAPATCLVMGRTYQEGDVLPHSTGNCVECSCGPEGRIECSPKDCVGLRPQKPGGSDLELFDLEGEPTGIENGF